MRAEVPRYPALIVDLPPHLRARLLAASAVLGVPIEELINEALTRQIDRLDRGRHEVVDRMAAESLHRADLSISDGEDRGAKRRRTLRRRPKRGVPGQQRKA